MTIARAWPQSPKAKRFIWKEAGRTPDGARWNARGPAEAIGARVGQKRVLGAVGARGNFGSRVTSWNPWSPLEPVETRLDPLGPAWTVWDVVGLVGTRCGTTSGPLQDHFKPLQDHLKTTSGPYTFFPYTV